MAKMEKDKMKSQTKPVKSQRQTVDKGRFEENRCGDDLGMAQDKNDTLKGGICGKCRKRKQNEK